MSFGGFSVIFGYFFQILHEIDRNEDLGGAHLLPPPTYAWNSLVNDILIAGRV